ncbi:hypothetical protein [Flavobacterium sp.]|uniref:hypothetical protein n=1 Tax=Flavobacterium sp. TaxID=239 RepID=UPI00286EA383|nr:hypothetical protein [Flavobacterium sp.]
MTDKHYEVLFPLLGGTEIVVSDKERDLKIVFDYLKPFDLEDEEVFDFIVNDVTRRMNEIVDQYERFNGDQLLYPTEVE